MSNVQQAQARACSACGVRPERYDGTYYDPPLCPSCWQARKEAVSIDGDAGVADRILPVSLRSQPDRTHNLKCPTCGEPWIDCPHNLSDTEPCAPLDPDRIETAARAGTVISLLERCSEELARLELVPSSDADDVNALSAARGFVARARNLLCGRFQ